MTSKIPSIHQVLAKKVMGYYQQLPQVKAIALSGSQVNRVADSSSDIDLYVYHTEPIAMSERERIVAESGSIRADVGMTFWGPGDEWVDAVTGIGVDVIYWETAWIEEQIDRVLLHHQPSVGYSTAFWHTIRNSQIIHDPDGWFTALVEKAQQDYPEPLRQAIITHNYPLLRQVIPAYFNQIKKAIQRDDPVSVNHRVAEFFASYFDVLFALNRLPHPGEKRLLKIATERCHKQPTDMVEQITSILRLSGITDEAILGHINNLVDGLDAVMVAEGFEVAL
ncbi:DUF4037 domain-containing protein [Anaerolineales bacterium HSG25]|nr:DUF4037 domain-containing protein [Anaerolineales bacterium HSG25]